MRFWTTDDFSKINTMRACTDARKKACCEKHPVCSNCRPIEVTETAPEPLINKFRAGQLVWYVGPKERGFTPGKFYLIQKSGQESLFIQDDRGEHQYGYPCPKDFRPVRIGQLVWCMREGTTYYRQMHRIDGIDKDLIMLESGCCYDANYLRLVCIDDRVITTGKGGPPFLNKGEPATIISIGENVSEKDDKDLRLRIRLHNRGSISVLVHPENVLLVEDAPVAETPAKFPIGQLVWFLDKGLPHHYGEIWRVRDIDFEDTGNINLEYGNDACRRIWLSPELIRPVVAGDKVITTGEGAPPHLNKGEGGTIFSVLEEARAVVIVLPTITAPIVVSPEAIMLADMPETNTRSESSEQRKNCRDEGEKGGRCYLEFAYLRDQIEGINEQLRNLESV